MTFTMFLVTLSTLPLSCHVQAVWWRCFLPDVNDYFSCLLTATVVSDL